MIFRKKKKEATCAASVFPRNPAECMHVFRFETKTTTVELTCLACGYVHEIAEK